MLPEAAAIADANEGPAAFGVGIEALLVVVEGRLMGRAAEAKVEADTDPILMALGTPAVLAIVAAMFLITGVMGVVTKVGVGFLLME